MKTDYYTLIFNRQKWIDDDEMDQYGFSRDVRESVQWAKDIDGKQVTSIDDGHLCIDFNNVKRHVNIDWCDKRPIYDRKLVVVGGNK